MRSWPLAIALTAASCALYAQPQDRAPAPPPWASRDYLKATTLVSPDPALAQVEVLFRCSTTSLVALRSTESTLPYLRKGELTIELFDSSGTSHAREIERIELPALDPDTADAPLAWIEQRISFRVPPGRYEVRAELQDLQSKNRLLRSAPVFTPPPVKDSLRVVPVFFTMGTGGTAEDTIRPQNFGDDLLFASRGSLLVQIPDIDSMVQFASVTARYLVLEAGEAQPALWREEKLSELPLLFGRTLSPAGAIKYILRPTSGATSGAFLLVPLPLDQLPLRRYRMEFDITTGSRHATVSVSVMMLWPDQPESLRDVEYALESLRFITTGRTLDSLRSGSFEARRNKLESFWKERDATPATVDNPLMTEYYRRIDYAREHFGTLKQRDGTRTDRGKIHVLNGPPSRTDRMLDPVNGFTETWTYDRTRKRFVFLDRNRDGTYTLVTTGPQ
jgi:GWxTD domain-containing protein